MAIYEVALKWGDSDSKYYNVLHFDITGQDPINFADMANEIGTAFTTHLATNIVSAVTLEGMVVREDTPGSVGQEFDINEAGTATNGDYAGALALQINKKTDGLVRPTRGWMFIPGVSATQLGTDGRWEGAVRTNAQLFVGDLLNFGFADAGNATMLIKANNPSAPNTNAYNEVLALGAAAVPKTLRSRQPGIGV